MNGGSFTYNRNELMIEGVMTERERLVSQLSLSHAAMQAVVDITPPNVRVVGVWKIKQVIDHLTGWDDVVIQTLKAFIAGQVVESTRLQPDLFNRQIVHLRRELELQQSLSEWKERRQKLLWLLRQVPDEQLEQEMLFPWGGQGRVCELVELLAAHENDHAAEIEAAVVGER